MCKVEVQGQLASPLTKISQALTRTCSCEITWMTSVIKMCEIEVIEIDLVADFYLKSLVFGGGTQREFKTHEQEHKQTGLLVDFTLLIVMYAVADLHSKLLDAPASKFFQFHAVFEKNWQNRMLAPSEGLVPPPRGNPGSATGTGYKQIFHWFCKTIYDTNG